MKYIKVITVLLFSLLILAPLATFNFQPEAVSIIDNRMLAENPFTPEGVSGQGLKTDIQNYLSDRIGFRDEMISAYTVLNDKLFGKMVHPSYTYGKDGYVFGAGLTVYSQCTEFHVAFADMIKEIQDYCDARSVPFIFVFEPAKPAVLTEYIADGINYDRSWVDEFLALLDERGVRYVDNTVTLREKTEEGEVVFNQKYDANHWNDLGAYYGTQAIVAALREQGANVHLTEIDEITIEYDLQTSLPVSDFPISEFTPKISIDMDYNYASSGYNEEVYRHPSYQGFGRFINQELLDEGAARALVLQGSYMNGFGYKYLINAFGEYVYVHDYQNVIDFSYYFNIFKPECVVIEAAEYTLSESYFNYNNMLAMDLNPVLEQAEEDAAEKKEMQLDDSMLEIEQGTVLTKIRWKSDLVDYAWIRLGDEYDMKVSEDGYEVSVKNEVFDAYKDSMEIVTLQDETLVIYH
ncbi:MAG: hypothetical protein J6J18_05315 [Oscillospiraceae bacterium]|nr:hypothetical protein [Oscillospiraceae bacterium]